MKKNFRNPLILNKFLKYLASVQNCSSHTIKAYKSDLLIFFDFIKTYLEIDIPVKDFNAFILANVKTADIIAFLVHLNYNKNNNPVTRQHRLVAIRKFYNWLFSTYKIGEGRINPANEIENAGRIKRLPKYLNLEQARRIQNIFTLENSKFPIRNNTIISLFLSTGIRVSELINIDLKHINLENNTIKILGKGNKERIVYLNQHCKNQLLEYLNYRKRHNLENEEALFLNRNNKRIGIDGVEDICQKAYKLLGVGDRGYTTHTLRHTAATLLYTYSKNDILIIKSFLGHESLVSTQIYTHLEDDIIRNATDKNPLNVLIEEKEGYIDEKFNKEK